MKRDDKVRTVYGKIETVLSANSVQVVTYESARALTWYHPTKVWRVK